MGEVSKKLKSYSLTRSVESRTKTQIKYVHYGDIHTGIAQNITINNKLPWIKLDQSKEIEKLKRGDIIVADASEDYKGIADAALIEESLPYNIIAGLHTIAFRPNNQLMDSKFIFYSLQNINFKRYGYKIGTGLKVFGISANNFFNFNLKFPNILEQNKISTIINKLKNLLALYERKLKLLSRVKKYFLDNLFAKKEYPNLRFKGFTDAWKQRKLSSILIERKDLSTESKEFPLSSFIQEKGVVPKSQRYDRSFLVKDSSKKYKVTKFGDFIYSSNNLDTGSIGLNSYGNAVISPVYSVFSSKNLNVLETNFVNLLFQQNFYKNKMLRFRQGVMYGQLKIKEDDFLKIRVNVPSQTEIKNITNLFSKIESYATLLENKKKQLVQIKSILLNTMFI